MSLLAYLCGLVLGAATHTWHQIGPSLWISDDGDLHGVGAHVRRAFDEALSRQLECWVLLADALLQEPGHVTLQPRPGLSPLVIHRTAQPCGRWVLVATGGAIAGAELIEPHRDTEQQLIEHGADAWWLRSQIGFAAARHGLDLTDAPVTDDLPAETTVPGQRAQRERRAHAFHRRPIARRHPRPRA